MWSCRKCKERNVGRAKKCVGCGKVRPAKKKPAHMAALDLPYEFYVDLNGGEFCGACKKPAGTKRLDRDHDHRTGIPRGLLCRSCNRLLSRRIEPLIPLFVLCLCFHFLILKFRLLF